MKTEDNIKEATLLDGQGNGTNIKPENGSGDWKRDAAVAGAGILLGAAGTYAATSLTSKKTPVTAETDTPAEDQPAENITISTVNRDNLSFSDAFASAREEVGTAGAFEWHGRLYSTFTAEEWADMSDEERDAYHSRINWQPSDNAELYLARAASHDTASPQTDTSEHIYAASEEHTESGNDRQNITAEDAHAEEQHVPEVEVLGVVHDNDLDMNIGGVIIDGHEVVVVDVDTDNTFDYAMSDLNHDGKLQENEVVDISEQDITVDDVGGFIDPGEYTADDGTPADDMYVEV